MALCLRKAGSKMTGQAALPHCNIHRGEYPIRYDGRNGRYFQIWRRKGDPEIKRTWACGKHKGETKISHRGRKRLRYWLFQAAKSAVAHAEEFKKLHGYYTTREQNPLKKMQSLIAIACKLLRIIFTILKKGIKYDPRKMLKDIRRESRQESLAA